MRGLRRIVRLWRGEAGWLVAGAGMAVLAGAAAILLLAAAAGLAGRAPVWLAAGAIGLPVVVRLLGVARVMLRYGERLVTHGAMFRALASVRVWFFTGVSERMAGGLGLRRSGDVLARLVGDVDALDGVYLRILVPFAAGVVLLPGVVWALAVRNGGLAALVGVLFLAAAMVLPWVAARGSLAGSAGVAVAAGGLRTAVLDAVTGLREVRAAGAEAGVREAVESREVALAGMQRRVARRAALAGMGSFLCGQAALGVVLVWPGLSAGWAILAAFVVVAAFDVVAGLPRAGALAGRAEAGARRVVEAAEGVRAVAEPAVAKAAPLAGGLAFEGVRFRWEAGRRLVLDGLSLVVPDGARVAVLGPSGAGKSTLVALALKVAAPEAGRVRLGGVDLAELRGEDVRSRVAWLGQTTQLFQDTVRNNLLLGRPGAEEGALWQALERAQVADVVRGLPGGLDAWLGEGGAGLSGGQARRVALARTLLRDAPVLILDEPAAGLDLETERAFLETLNRVTAGRTVVLIVHRLLGVEQLDRVWRLSAGRAVAAAA